MSAVVPIRLRISKAFLIHGERPVLVDTGSPGEERKIEKQLARHGVAFRDLALILHTHGHTDHAGSTAAVGRLSGAPTAVHAADADMVRSGRNRRLIPVDLRSRLLLPFVNCRFEGCEPTHLIDGNFSIRRFGIAGEIVEVPGHTTGSIALVLDSGEAIVGDAVMGGYLGGAIFPSRPQKHYFAELSGELRPSLERLLATKAHVFYPGHGGPLSRGALEEFVNRWREG